jgi:hypothetical protein
MKARYGALLATTLFLGPLALAQQSPATPPQNGEQPQPGQGSGQWPGQGSGGGSGQWPGQGTGGGSGGGSGQWPGQGSGGGSGGNCPMSDIADVSVEQTADGAVLRLTAKDPNQVQQVQRMAQMMGNCTGAGQQQPTDQP